MGVIIKTENVIKEYSIGKETTRVLDNINISINEGEFVSIMGPSGSGKSTLLYVIGGLDKATSGTVLLKDKDIEKLKDKQESIMRRRELGFVFQFYNLIPNLNVEDNILLPILLDGKKASKFKKELDEILEIVGLSDKRKYTPRELSGGQQQRVAIARALINNPDIILADEPIGNLDSKTGTEIMELLQRINKTKGKTIVMVTHSKQSTSYSDRVIYVKDGKISDNVPEN